MSSLDIAPLSSDNGVLAPIPEAAEAAKHFLERAVPSYMIPEFFIPLRKLPKTDSMKMDRKTLRNIVNSLSQTDLMLYRLDGKQQNMHDSDLEHPIFEPVEMLTETESLLRLKWASLVNVPVHLITLKDDFFALGGNSIRAMRLVAALRASGYMLGVSEIFKEPNLARMALKMRNISSIPITNQSETSAAGIKPESVRQLGSLAKANDWLNNSNIEAIAPATDMQVLMLSSGYGQTLNNMMSTVSIETHTGELQQTLDLFRLQDACQQVLRQHGILRTVFLQEDKSLLQITLRKVPFNQVHVLPAGEKKTQQPSLKHSEMLDILPRFDLTVDDSGSECLGFRLTIHHACYDAISMGHIFDDLKLAYSGLQVPARQPSFYKWASWMASKERVTESQAFWKGLLKGSTPYPLEEGTKDAIQSQDSLLSGPKYRRIAMEVPKENLSTPHGTTSTVLKAAWSYILSRVLERDDAVFSFVAANRSSGAVAHESFESVAGPCINLVPVRARMEEGNSMNMAALVGQLQKQFVESLPHQHVGVRSIVNNCTRWSSTRFNSTVLFQNHEAFGHEIILGDTKCSFVGTGPHADFADVWVIATPQADDSLHVELVFSLSSVRAELCEWIADCFKLLLNTLPLLWETTMNDIGKELAFNARP